MIKMNEIMIKKVFDKNIITLVKQYINEINFELKLINNIINGMEFLYIKINSARDSLNNFLNLISMVF